MLPCRGYKKLVVLTDTLTRWTEAFLTRMDKSTEVAKNILKEIIPWFGLPCSLQSENRSSFISKTIQLISEPVGIKYYLLSTWIPQTSGKVEWTNQTLKRALAKLCQETSENWVKLLPIALRRTRGSPKVNPRLSPFEMLYGRPLLTLDLIFDRDPSRS